MINTQVLKGNLIRQDYTTAFVLNQGDKGVPFKIELLENGAPYILQSTDIVTIEWLKPNGSPFLQDTGITKGDTYVEITTPEAISQSSGSGTFNIIISDGTTRKGTIKREYKVVSTSLRPGSVSEGVITDAITELRNLNTKLAETVQNNQEIINSNSAATKSDIASVNSSLEDIAINANTYGIVGDDATDNTSILQSLLDKGGLIRIVEPGIYKTKTLKIGDNTTLEVYPGAVLKLKNNTANYLITNKDYTNGNKNIKLIGVFDNNYQYGNDKVGGYADGKYPGHCLFFNNVVGLEYNKVTVKNAAKYASLIVNSKNIKCEDITFDTHSDGLHFQHPIFNCHINNVKGVTGDDTVAFTLGDYTDYKVSNVGNFEKITVNNVYADEGTLNVIKITGSGEGNQYCFKDMEFNNIFGNNVQIGLVRVVLDNASNTDLQQHKLYNVRFNNIRGTITTTDTSKMAYEFVDIADGDIYIDGFDIDTTRKNISFRQCNLNSINISRNLLRDAEGNYDSILNISQNSTIKTLNIDNITLNNFNCKFLTTLGGIEKININKCYITGKSNTLGTFIDYIKYDNTPVDTVTCNITVRDSSFDTFAQLFSCYASLKITLINTIVNNVGKRFLLRTNLTENDTIFVNVIGCEGEFNPNFNGSVGKFRINMDSGHINCPLSSISPECYDTVIQEYIYHLSDDDPNHRTWGKYIYNGTEWKSVFGS